MIVQDSHRQSSFLFKVTRPQGPSGVGIRIPRGTAKNLRLSL